MILNNKLLPFTQFGTDVMSCLWMQEEVMRLEREIPSSPVQQFLNRVLLELIDFSINQGKVVMKVVVVVRMVYISTYRL